MKDAARGGEVQAVCGWHQVCAAWLWASISGMKEYKAGPWGGTKSSFAEQQEEESHANIN